MQQTVMPMVLPKTTLAQQTYFDLRDAKTNDNAESRAGEKMNLKFMKYSYAMDIIGLNGQHTANRLWSEGCVDG